MKGLFDLLLIVVVICGILAAGDPIMSWVVRVFPRIRKLIDELPMGGDSE